MKLWFPLMVLISATPRTSNAVEARQSYGIGTHSCGEFAKSYVANPTVTEDLYFTWAQGSMSGLNLAALGNNFPYRDLNGEDMISHKTYIRTYCDAHPLSANAMAVITLYSSFPQMKANSN